MSCIRIVLNQEISKQSLQCKIDDQLVDFTYDNNCVIIDQDIQAGVHKLSLRLIDNIKFTIEDVFINECGVRMMLYMSWVEDNQGQRIQPATALWESNQTWILPFGYPISFWTTLVYGKLPNGVFGTNLFDRSHLYFPETLTLPEKYPQLLRDFYSRDFDFVALPKDCDPLKLPYSGVNIDVPPVDLVNKANQEILDKFDWISQQDINVKKEGQLNYNQKEINPSQWKKLWLKKYNQLIVDHEVLPNVWNLVEHLQLNDIRGIYIGILPPGSFIAPHLDDDAGKFDHYKDSYYLYLPLSWHAGNYFKFAGAGILKDVKILNVCNQSYVHSLVNDSDNYRVILSMWVGRANNPNIELTYV